MLRQKHLVSSWESRCEFLDRPIPDLDFPRLNEAAALEENIGLVARRGIHNTLRSLFKIVIPLAALRWCKLCLLGMGKGQREPHLAEPVGFRDESRPGWR